MAIVEPVQSSNGQRRLKLKSPSNGDPVGEIAVNTQQEVAAAIERARRAQPVWAALTFDERGKYMRKALKILLRRQEEMVDVIRRETGRSKVETLMMEIFASADCLNYYAKHAKKLLRDEKPSLHLLRTKKAVVTYKPLGVVGVITPWNGPFILSLNPTVQALMAGNAVIVKPSEVTPFSGGLVQELFDEAGLPKGVLQVLQGDGETGAALVDGGVDKIHFTGSVRTGKKIGEACGRNLVPCVLELGGKDAALVCADADLDRAAKGVVFGSFMNCGQFCAGTERVYVVDEVADELIRKVVDYAKTVKQGAEGEYDVGPMIDSRQLTVIERHMKDAVEKGAKVLLGGKRNTALGENFYEPTVITDVSAEMVLMREESFGPIVAIQRVKDEAEGVRRANDSDYGLSGSVYTKNEEKAYRLARRMDTGSVCVNDSSVTYGAHEVPFGGRKDSGLGQIHGANGLKGFCFAQPIIFDRFNAPEEPMWFPYTADKGKMLQRVLKWVVGSPVGRLLV